MKLHKIARSVRVMMVCLSMVTPCLEVRAEDIAPASESTQAETPASEPAQTEIMTPESTQAETPASEPAQTETPTPEPAPTEEPDVTLTETPAPEGSAQIAEQIVQDGSNVVVEEPEVFENDPLTEETEDNIQDDTEGGSEGSTATEEKNAIQKAVDKALEVAKNNSGIKEITIVVEDGTYNGDINISLKDHPSSLAKLYIITRDSFLDPGFFFSCLCFSFSIPRSLA